MSIFERVFSLVITYLSVDLNRLLGSEIIGLKGSFLVYLGFLVSSLYFGSVCVKALTLSFWLYPNPFKSDP